MSKTKLERAADIEQMIERLKKCRLTLIQSHKLQERKNRTHRLCKRSGYLEKVIPELATLTDEQFETVKAEMSKRNIMSYGMNRINTRTAYSAWGLDISDLERRMKKLKELNL